MSVANSRRVQFGEVEVKQTGEDPFAKVRPVTDRWDVNSTLLLFDARHAAYRAIHTREGLSAPDGTDTRGLHGFLEIVANCCSAFRTGRFVAVWDGGVEIKRRVHPEYKSRHDAPKNDEEAALVEQNRRAMKATREGTDAIGLSAVHHPMFEADDLIGITSRIAVPHGKYERVVIVSDDKDFYQLINDRVYVWRGVSKRLVGLAEFTAEFPFEPDRYVDYKALVGEPATGDNIPGVPGFGDKRAAGYIASTGGIEQAILHAIGSVSSGAKKVPKTDVDLASNKDSARLSYRLSHIARSAGDLADWCSDAEKKHSVEAYAACRSAVLKTMSGGGPLTTFGEAVRILRGRYGFAHETCEQVLRPMGYR